MGFTNFYTRARSASALSVIRQKVAGINALSNDYAGLSQEELVQAFNALKSLSFEDRKIKAFAIVREACKRSLGMSQFDVQLIGGLVLLDGKVAEMATGEGKTLSIVAPAATIALDGKGVHVVTANSYLAERDAALMRPAYEYLGLTVAHIDDKQSIEQKQASYACDIVYGVGHEFGFDYLKDNSAKHPSLRTQRDLHAAIVDEVDSILIDEARVPLIISKRGHDYSAGFVMLDKAVSLLSADKHYNADLKEKNVSVTEDGYAFLEEELAKLGLIEPGCLYAPNNLMWVRRLHSAVKAHVLFKRDRDYVIEAGELVLVDVGSGRKMPGRRFDDGLHEALEAKEGLKILPGNLTVATVTYQNFFGLYSRIGGLTGTALTDAEEFADIYNMEVVVIPTNKPRKRVQLADTVFLTKAEKFHGAVAEVKEVSSKGQPVLVGCATIRDAEVLSSMLTNAGVIHNVLTAKHLEKEAHIIANAGVSGTVTVATNMAGRGTDIALGGEKPEKAHFEDDGSYEQAILAWRQDEQKVIELGGLHVLGTERNGIRRVDNQLAGRSGRQGNPGSVHFILSLEDELLKVFGRSGYLKVLRKGLRASGSALSGKQVSTMVSKAQQSFENLGFDARKQLMKFDGVLAEQRKIVYELRDSLFASGPDEMCENAIRGTVQSTCSQYLFEFCDPSEQVDELGKALESQFGLKLPLRDWADREELEADEIIERVVGAAKDLYLGQNLDTSYLSEVILTSIDDFWAEHLTVLDELKQAANLKAHSGKNPLYEFTKEGFQLFNEFVDSVNTLIAETLLNPSTRIAADAAAGEMAAAAAAFKLVADVYKDRWIHRNEACPCGSGSRYKRCHGKDV